METLRNANLFNERSDILHVTCESGQFAWISAFIDKTAPFMDKTLVQSLHLTTFAT